MHRNLVDLPQAVTAPSWLLADLRAIDPSLDLIYMGQGKWLVGSVRPNSIRRQMATRMLDTAMSQLSVGARLTSRGIGRIRLALLAVQGFSPIAEYSGVPSGRIVEDVRRKDWMYRHLSDNDVQRLLDAEQEERREDALASAADPGRATDAWRHWRTLSHTVSRLDDPMKTYQRSSARTLHRTGTDAA